MAIAPTELVGTEPSKSEREEMRRSFVAEALESLRHYRETGLHLTADEVFEWLEKCETDPETPIPECHV